MDADTTRRARKCLRSATILPCWEVIVVNVLQTYEQMSQAVEREARQIWIVNVGDLKPYELNIEFFITYGWNASLWSYDNLDTFVSAWAQREFDVDVDTADTISEVMTNLTRWNNRRKPELLNSTTFSLTNYRE